MKTDLQILREARELIATPEQWTQRIYAEESSSSPTGHCYCLMGALLQAAAGDSAPDEGLVGLLGYRFATLVDFPAEGILTLWNDHPDRTHAEVLERLDTAIAELEGQGA